MVVLEGGLLLRSKTCGEDCLFAAKVASFTNPNWEVVVLK